MDDQQKGRLSKEDIKNVIDSLLNTAEGQFIREMQKRAKDKAKAKSKANARPKDAPADTARDDYARRNERSQRATRYAFEQHRLGKRCSYAQAIQYVDEELARSA